MREIYDFMRSWTFLRLPRLGHSSRRKGGREGEGERWEGTWEGEKNEGSIEKGSGKEGVLMQN